MFLSRDGLPRAPVEWMVIVKALPTVSGLGAVMLILAVGPPWTVKGVAAVSTLPIAGDIYSNEVAAAGLTTRLQLPETEPAAAVSVTLPG